jgi:hypothetical protein
VDNFVLFTLPLATGGLHIYPGCDCGFKAFVLMGDRSKEGNLHFWQWQPFPFVVCTSKGDSFPSLALPNLSLEICWEEPKSSCESPYVCDSQWVHIYLAFSSPLKKLSQILLYLSDWWLPTTQFVCGLHSGTRETVFAPPLCGANCPSLDVRLLSWSASQALWWVQELLWLCV